MELNYMQETEKPEEIIAQLRKQANPTYST